MGREQLLEDIAREARETSRWTGREAFDPRVMRALEEVPRDAFVPPDQVKRAWLNLPLPIGCGQTISQPYVVALMTDLLGVGPEDRVLEIGTGCGYQTAILAKLARSVHSIEVVPELAEAARKRLARLGYANAEVRTSDGAEGWPEQSPFDAIIVTAACPRVPPRLLEQLAPGGRLVLPVGGPMGQTLVVVEKDAEGQEQRRDVIPVAFVPLTGSERKAAQDGS